MRKGRRVLTAISISGLCGTAIPLGHCGRGNAVDMRPFEACAWPIGEHLPQLRFHDIGDVYNIADVHKSN